jgi:predicted DNA binding CopG/RHH family protein
MKENHMKGKSASDWERIDAMTEGDIDTTDIPPLGDDFFRNAKLQLPEGKTSVTIRLDSEVVKWLKSSGRGYQTKINAILRTYMNAVREHRT